MSEADRDGDSQMLSSSSSSSSAMFPSANDPPTPQNMNSHAMSHSELSPPDSEDPFPHRQAPLLPEDEMMDGTQQQHEAGDGTVVLELGGGEPGDGEKELEKEPGWAWKNQKAVEDYEKAMDAVVDRGFNLREFGDLFDEREGSRLG